jgi:hypothetical protein
MVDPEEPASCGPLARSGPQSPGEACGAQAYDAVVARFEKVKATFWSDSARGVQPPLTDDMVADAERLLGVRLPVALIELLRVQHGGIVADAWDTFPASAPTSWTDSHVPFDTLAGIGSAVGALSLLDTPYLVGEWGLPSPLVLLTGRCLSSQVRHGLGQFVPS